MVRSAAALRVSNHRGGVLTVLRDAVQEHGSSGRVPQRSFPRAATGSMPKISSPRTISTSSIMLTTTQT
jgi:hypothetical protein